MNKAEKARVEELERDLAFRWPTQAEPERMPPPESHLTAEGWDFNASSRLVERKWSQSNRHGGYYRGERMTASQGGRALYATEVDAYTALRWALCRLYASELRKVDLRAAQASHD